MVADEERGVLMIEGAVPGSEGGWVLIKDAVKRKMPSDLPFPARLRGAGNGAEDEPPEATETSDESGATAETTGEGTEA
jgi:large subunit ribosomal protein L3